MSTVAQINAQRKAAGLPLIRFNIRNLQPSDITDLRDAFAQLYAFSNANPGDSRGFWATARGHGYDQQLCHNNSRIFLTWHRGYVYMFEKALSSALQFKRQNPNLVLTLPFWDWTTFNSATDNPNGLPKVINDPTYVDGAGHTQTNPLFTARSMYRVVPLGLTGNDQLTLRYPVQLRANIPALASNVTTYMGINDYMTFSNSFNNGAHGTVHVVTGGQNPSSKLPGHTGDMTQVISAAYDPIFWLHHSMVDKVWFDWQATHGNSSVPADVLSAVVYGNFTGAGVLSTAASLKYIYSNQSPIVAHPVGSTVQLASTLEAAAIKSKPAPTGPKAGTSTVALGAVTAGFRRAQLDFHSLRPPKDSYEIRAYINNPKANEKTGLDHASFAGRLTLFGHGHCFAGNGHCDPSAEARDDYDLRPKHPLRFQKTEYSIDLTEPLQALVKKSRKEVPLDITLVTLGADGKQVAPGTVIYDGVSLTAT